MRVTIEVRRPARRKVVLLVAILALAVPAAVFANHQFPDVTNATPFHTEIGAIANAGITSGFADGKFYPGSTVTRQSMAAFMHRGFGRVAFAYWTPPAATGISVGVSEHWSSGFTSARQLTITVPGASNSFAPKQLVHVHGRLTFYTYYDGGMGCTCEFVARIRDTGTGDYGGGQFQTFLIEGGGPYKTSMDVEAVFAATPGSHTYVLEAALNWRSTATVARTFSFDQATSLTAMTFPFGPSGSNTLSAPLNVDDPSVNVGKPAGSAVR